MALLISRKYGKGATCAASVDLREVGFVTRSRDDIVDTRQPGTNAVLVLICTRWQVAGRQYDFLIPELDIAEPPPTPTVEQRIVALQTGLCADLLLRRKVRVDPLSSR